MKKWLLFVLISLWVYTMFSGDYIGSVGVACFICMWIITMFFVLRAINLAIRRDKVRDILGVFAFASLWCFTLFSGNCVLSIMMTLFTLLLAIVYCKKTGYVEYEP